MFFVLPGLQEHGIRGSMFDAIFVNTVLELINQHCPGVSVPLCAILLPILIFSFIAGGSRPQQEQTTAP